MNALGVQIFILFQMGLWIKVYFRLRSFSTTVSAYTSHIDNINLKYDKI